MEEGRTIVLVGATLIDGLARDPVADSVIIIAGKNISGVGRKDQLRLPKNCQIIDGNGMTVMPGMMDLHVHLDMGEMDHVVPSAGVWHGLNEPWALRGIKSLAYARRTLEMGFTTLRSVGDMGNVGVSVKNGINSGFFEGPRILACGQFLTTTGGHVDLMPPWLKRTDDESNVADGVEGVLKAVRRQWKMKVDWIKFYATGGIMDPEDKQEFNDDEMRALIEEAHSKEKPVCAHCWWAKGTLAAVRAGIDSVEHGTDLTEEIISLMTAGGIYLVPTLNVLDTLSKKGPELGLSAVYTERMGPHRERHVKSFKMALESGVQIALGTDAGFNCMVHGNNALELEHLVRFGMTPIQAIVTATSSSAAALRLGDRLGSVEPGKLADIVVVDGNPLEDIKILQDKRRIALVMKEGSICVNRIADRCQFSRLEVVG